MGGVDLQAEYRVQDLLITNRGDCCGKSCRQRVTGEGVCVCVEGGGGGGGGGGEGGRGGGASVCLSALRTGRRRTPACDFSGCYQHCTWSGPLRVLRVPDCYCNCES